MRPNYIYNQETQSISLYCDNGYVFFTSSSEAVADFFKIKPVGYESQMNVHTEYSLQDELFKLRMWFKRNSAQHEQYMQKRLAAKYYINKLRELDESGNLFIRA